MTSSAPENATMIERECDHYDPDGKSGKSTVDHIELRHPIPTNPGNKSSKETISSEIILKIGPTAVTEVAPIANEQQVQTEEGETQTVDRLPPKPFF